MIDTVGESGPEKRFQECYHSKEKGSFDTGSWTEDGGILTVADGPLVDGTHRLAVPILYLVQGSNLYKEWGLSLETVEQREIADRMFNNPRFQTTIDLKPRDPFDTNFSIWYVVADLYQMKGLWRGLFGTERLKARLRAWAGVSGRRTAKELAIDNITPRTASRELANRHLSVKFGLLPMVDDITRLYSLIQRWTNLYDDMDSLLTTNRTWYSPPFDFKVEYPRITEVGECRVDISGVYAFPCIVKCKSGGDSVTARHFRTLKFGFECPEFQGWLARMRQFVDAFGVLDPAALWDVVPFSFVVDWFFGIGGWLHKNRPRFFPANVVIKDYCESIRIDNRREWYYQGYAQALHQSGLTYHTDLPLGSDHHSMYIRRLFNPSASVQSLGPKIGKGVVSLNRITTAASLIAQRIPR